MTDGSKHDDEQERDAIEDLDLDDDAAKNVSGGAYEPYLSSTGQKQGPIKNP